jgi:hypothetical protein
MSAEFLVYLRLGLAHIADLRGYDHILFVAALTGGYAPAAWRRLLWLVTAFTVGHSVTLALATLRLVNAPVALVEAAIPATIVLTSALAVLGARPGRASRAGLYRAGGDLPDDGPSVRPGLLYLLAAGFGLVHGLGFSNYLRALLGGEASLALPLLAFNIGLELGQLLIVAVVLLLGATFVRGLGFARRDWVLLLAGATGGVALVLLVERLGPLMRG